MNKYLHEHQLVPCDDADRDSTPPRPPTSNHADIDAGDTSSSESNVNGFATGGHRRSSRRAGAKRGAASQPSSLALGVVRPQKRGPGRPPKASTSGVEVNSSENDATAPNNTPSKGRKTGRKSTPKRLTKQQLEAENMEQFWDQFEQNSQGQLPTQMSESAAVFNVFQRIKAASLGKGSSNTQFSSSIAPKI